VIPIGRAAFFAAGGFDPSAYPGFAGDWLVDLAHTSGGNIVDIDSNGSSSGPMTAFGTTAINTWPTGVGGAAAKLDNLALCGLRVSSVQGSTEVDFDSFSATYADSAVANANAQWEVLIGTFGGPFIGGVIHTYSFTSETRLYDQSSAWVDATAPIAGAQIIHIRRRHLESPNTRVWRNDVLILQGDTDAIEANAITIGTVYSGAPLGPGYQFEGLFKRLSFYTGALLTEPDAAEIRAAYAELYL